MKLLREKYFAAVREWDSKHRIVGKTAIETLISESEEALGDFILSQPTRSCLLDIGAGAAILGLPWLWLNEKSKTVLIEPDKKKSAFLRDLIANKMPEMMSRVLILPKRVEDVSRGTILSFAGDNFFAASRAFSGDKSLEESFAASELRADPLYIFEGAVTRNKKFMLRQVLL